MATRAPAAVKVCEKLPAACKAVGQEVYLQMREGYDHGYFFIQSFISQHLTWHSHLLAK